MALGEVDYGLLGVVGGLVAFVSYLNGIIAGAMGRFFAIAIGEEKTDAQKGLESGQMWFTTAVVVQTIVPTLLLIICYPIGEWAVRRFLEIPPDRIEACLWVWRFACASAYVAMVVMPWNAMYGAHQYIAELTVYSFATTTLNACFLYYMITHPAVWLAKLAFWQCLLSILPNIIIAIRARVLFPECKIRAKYMQCWSNIKKMASYALWNAWGSLGALLRAQGLAILVNKYFGARANASITVGTMLSTQCNTLSSSMQGAFAPAIFNAWGAREYDKARNLAYRTCKFGTLLVLVFSLPLALEVDEVLRLWLKNPPQYAAGICLFVMAMTVIDKLAVGHMLCVNANGKVAKYQAFLGTSLVMTLPLAWVLIEAGVGIYSIGWAMIATMAVCASGRVLFARRLVGMSARRWLKSIFTPVLCAAVAALGVGLLPLIFMQQSIGRVCVTTGVVELILMPLAWFVILDSSERGFLRSKMDLALRRFRG
jgi:O-antigen/teichoic acid export membrane protein